MNDEEFETLKARLRGQVARASTPAARTLHRFVADHLDATEVRSGALEARPTKPPTRREQLLDDGLIFSVRDQDRADGAAEHRARRRRADEETQHRDRVWQRLRDSQGIDAADAWLRGEG